MIVSSISSEIKKIFYDVLLLLEKFGSTITIWSQKINRNSGLKGMNRLRRRRKQFRQLAKWWSLVIFVDYVEKDKTINGEYYAGLLQHLDQEIKNKRLQSQSVINSSLID